MKIKTLEVGPFGTNCYLVFSENTKTLYIIDPGDDGEFICREAEKFDYEKVEILLTHFHIDHINAVGYCAGKLGVDYVRLRTPDHNYYTSPENCLPPYFPEPLKNPPVPREYEENQDFKVLALPGHTPGGAGILFGKDLFCGDTLFLNSCGRTDLPGGDDKEITRSLLDVLMALPDETRAYCGHGPVTTIGAERRNNPYINGTYL
ncbi:MAG: MBL fold metallo-hydrolase [Lentisphaeria bacterium]|nr:MBL fold metallo-hydrolase [Lentisphaeria bacterium]